MITINQMKDLVKQVDGIEDITDRQAKDLVEMFEAYYNAQIKVYEMACAVEFLEQRPDLEPL